jgi:hypothetical protein
MRSLAALAADVQALETRLAPLLETALRDALPVNTFLVGALLYFYLYVICSY